MGAPERLRTMFTDGNPTHRATRRVLWILVLVALGLRLAGITFQPLWWDEGWSLYFSTSDAGKILDLTSVDIHPPLYYLLLHAWIRILGSSALAVRLFSVLVGVATVPLLYATGRRLMGRKGGLLAAFLLAVSPFHIYYSQEVRMYGLVTLLGLVATYCAIRWETEEWDPAKWAWGLGYVLAAAAAIHTQYYAAFLLLALNLAVLLPWLRRPGARSEPPPERRRPNIRRLLPWWAAQVAVAAVYVPWLWYAGGRLLTYVRFKVGVEQDPSLTLPTYVSRHLAALNWGHAEGYLAEWWWLGLFPLLVLALLFIPLLSHRARAGARQSGQDRATLRWALTILLVTVLCGFAVNLFFPFNPARSERLLLLALPAYLLLFAAGVLALGRARRYVALVPLAAFLLTCLWSLALFYTVPRYPDDDYRPVAARVQALGLPDDIILNVHPWQVGYFRAYIPDDDVRPALFLTPREVIPRERQIWADDQARMAAGLDTLLAEHGRLWFPDHRAMGRVLEGQIEAHLVEQAYPVLAEWYGENTVLSLFSAGSPEAPGPGRGAIASFGDWLTLQHAAFVPGPLEAGWGVVAVDLGWLVTQPPDEGYTVGLRLVDPSGRVWAQRDAPPAGGLVPFAAWSTDGVRLDHHGLLVPAGTPPGEYELTARVYRSDDLLVLPASFQDGSGGEVVLGKVRVARPQVSPPIEALGLENAAEVDFGDRLRLLGYNVHRGEAVLPGEPVEVELAWQAQSDPGEDFLPRLQLLDGDGAVLAKITEKPVVGTYPTAWWKAGELVRDPHALPIPAAVSPGTYTLALSLIRASDGEPVEFERGRTLLPLDVSIQVQGRPHNFEPPVPQYVQVVPSGPSVDLVGYDLNDTALLPGSVLEVTLHWHALDTPGADYRTFVHLLNSTGDTVAQHDGPPGEGGLPTMGWLPGEYLLDPHAVPIPFDLPGGTYCLEVGFYDPTTGLRPGDGIILDTPIVVTGG